MRSVVTGILIAIIAATFASQAYAEAEYYIVLGSEPTEDEAISQWHAISEKHETLLKGLHFTPHAVLQMDNTVKTRMEAGPLGNKKAAEKLCDKLFAEKTPCFILEGEKQPPHPAEPVAVNNAPVVSENAAPLPWLSSPATESEPAAIITAKTEEHHGLFHWLFGGDESSKKSQNVSIPHAIKKQTKGDVEVAEAIRVPLTNNATPMENPPPKLEPTFKEESSDEDETAASDAGWLNVYAFASEDSANDFWELVRTAAPAQTAGLRVRTITPLATYEHAIVSLNIGPFPSWDDANTFCHDSIESVNRELNCRFTKSEPQGNFHTVGQRYEHGDRYNARRQRLLAQLEKANNPSPINKPFVPVKAYWVQVASAADQIEAMNSWKSIRENNADLLENLHTRISTSLMGQSGYVVRVGPLNSNDEAISLCNNLKERGVNCLVYSNM